MLSELADLRLRAVAARSRLRELTEQVKLARAEAELRAIDAAGGEKALGANAEARERALTIAVAGDVDYRRTRSELANIETEVERLQTEIDIRLDERRAREWEIRELLVDALLARGVQVERATNGDDRPSGFDESLEWAADEQVDELVELPF